MRERENKLILDRETGVEDVKKHFNEQIELLKEIANYGTNLMIRCYEVSDKKISDVVILIALLKHCIALIDSVEILITQGAVLAANIPARSLFESSLYIEWILKEDTEKRSNQYYVWDLRQRILWAKRMIKEDDEQRKFSKKIGTYGSEITELLKKFENEAKQEVEKLEKLLSKKYNKISQEFESLKQRLKRGDYEVEWFQPWGPSSLSDMASRLNRTVEYHVFYDQFSKIMHSTIMKEHVSFDGKTIGYEQIRKLSGIDTLLTVVIVFSIKTYIVVLEKYRPAEIQNFRIKYIDEWRKRFLSIKGVKYKEIPHFLNF